MKGINEIYQEYKAYEKALEYLKNQEPRSICLYIKDTNESGNEEVRYVVEYSPSQNPNCVRITDNDSSRYIKVTLQHIKRLVAVLNLITEKGLPTEVIEDDN
jgi:replication-associated recombination protein RarA